MTPPRTKAYFSMIIVSLIWGAAGPVIKFTLLGFPVLIFLAYRFALSSWFFFNQIIFKTAVTNHKHSKNIHYSPATIYLLLEYSLFAVTFSLGLLFLGLEKTTALEASLLSMLGPFVIAAFGVLFLKEVITASEKLGMIILLSGAILTVIEPLLKNGLGHTQLSGNVLILLYLLTNAYSAVLAKKLLRKGVMPELMTNVSFAIGFLTILPITLYFHGPKQILGLILNLDIKYHLGVMFMAFLSGNLAYTLWNKAQKTIEISEVALFSYLSPIFAIPLAVIWLKEKITPLYILGTIIIITGVVVAERKTAKKAT